MSGAVRFGSQSGVVHVHRDRFEDIRSDARSNCFALQLYRLLVDQIGQKGVLDELFNGQLDVFRI